MMLNMAESLPAIDREWRFLVSHCRVRSKLRGLAIFLASALLLESALAVELRPVGALRMMTGGAEIIDYDRRSSRLLSTVSDSDPESESAPLFGLQVIDLEDPSAPASLGFIPITKADASFAIDAVSSVAVDPRGRGFAVAALIPRKSHRRVGCVALIDLRSNRLVKTVRVGYHPDCVVFDPSGRYVLVANEGEHVGFPRRPAPGSLSRIDLGSVRTTDDLETLDQSVVKTVTLTDPVLLRKLRFPVVGRLPEARFLDVEPEYIAVHGNQAFVSLQENNAVGVFDIAAARWQQTFPMGQLPVTVDSSSDGPYGGRLMALEDWVQGMPMPDGLCTFQVGGRVYVATASEGDALENDQDLMLAKRARFWWPRLDRDYRERLWARYGSDPLLEENFGELEVSKIDGDTDGDGDIDRLTTFGSRSFTILDGRTGQRVYDSGSFFEDYTREHLVGAYHNVSDGEPAEFDLRANDKGAEIEAITSANIGRRAILFMAAERYHTIYAFDATQPERPTLKAVVFALPMGHESPESLRFIPAGQRRDGRALLVAAFEETETILVMEVVH